MKSLICVFAIAAAATAQSNSGAVGGPLLGVVFDAGQADIRSLTGIPGSAILGGPLDSGAALGQAAVSAAGYAVAVEYDSGAAVLVTSSGRRPLAGIPTGAAVIVLSPRGSSAALYFKSTRTAYVVTGLPDTTQ